MIKNYKLIKLKNYASLTKHIVYELTMMVVKFIKFQSKLFL